jgi:iron complex transport system substrate-binding protein
MIERAGGLDVLGEASTPSRSTTWEEVTALEPELIVLGPCGFSADEAAERAADIDLRCPTFAVDGDSYYSRPAPRLAHGVRQLAHLLHPDVAPDPELPEIRLDRESIQR